MAKPHANARLDLMIDEIQAAAHQRHDAGLAVAQEFLLDSHKVSRERIKRSTADMRRWLQTVRIPNRAREEALAARTVERSKVNTLTLALDEYAMASRRLSRPATRHAAVDPDRYYQEFRDNRDRYEESCRDTQELYRSGDLRHPCIKEVS